MKDIDTDRVYDATLALMSWASTAAIRATTPRERGRASTGPSTDRLHAKGLISDPVGTAKSVWLTAKG